MVSNKKTNTKIDWTKIRSDYLSGNFSYRELAQKYNIPFSTIAKKGKKNDWVSLKEKRRNRIDTKVAQKIEDEEVNNILNDIERVCNVAKSLIAKAEKATEELQNYNLKTKKTEKNTKYKPGAKQKMPIKESETITEEITIGEGIIDTKRLKEISSALLDIKNILSTNSNENDEETGIIILPQQEDLTPPDENSDAAESGEKFE